VKAVKGKPEAGVFWIHARLLGRSIQPSVKFYGRTTVDEECNGLALDEAEGRSPSYGMNLYHLERTAHGVREEQVQVRVGKLIFQRPRETAIAAAMAVSSLRVRKVCRRSSRW